MDFVCRWDGVDGVFVDAALGVRDARGPVGVAFGVGDAGFGSGTGWFFRVEGAGTDFDVDEVLGSVVVVDVLAFAVR